jgi:NADH dehydrogenase (ubiquinone) 1 alpha subcomplex subunit 5
MLARLARVLPPGLRASPLAALQQQAAAFSDLNLSDRATLKKFVGIEDLLGREADARGTLTSLLQQLRAAVGVLPADADYRRAIEATVAYRLKVRGGAQALASPRWMRLWGRARARVPAQASGTRQRRRHPHPPTRPRTPTRPQVLEANDSDAAVEEVLDAHLEELILEAREEINLVPIMAGGAAAAVADVAAAVAAVAVVAAAAAVVVVVGGGDGGGGGGVPMLLPLLAHAVASVGTGRGTPAAAPSTACAGGAAVHGTLAPLTPRRALPRRAKALGRPREHADAGV